MAGMSWRVVFFRDKEGAEPVKDFILEQPDGAIAEILHVFDLLYKFESLTRASLRGESEGQDMGVKD